jgi:hypothetical protein
MTTKIASKLDFLVERVSTATDRAEEAVARAERARWSGPALRRALGQAKASVSTSVHAAYLMLDTLRPLLTAGLEVKTEGERQMVEALRVLDREHYGPLACNSSSLTPSEVAERLHKLWSQMDTVYRLYVQAAV